MKLARFLGFSTLFGMFALVNSCRLGESLDDFTSGASTIGGASGASGGAGGSGGTGTGGTGMGGAAGTAGTGGIGLTCENAPTSCNDLGISDSDRTFGCCNGNFAYWCEFENANWTLLSENCDVSNKSCAYDASEKAMRCVSGGSGGSSACESGECVGSCADCNDDMEDGCETDTNTDPEHCGECNHSCQGGDCVGGTCQIVVLASNQKTPWGIAVDDTSVFWLTEGEGSVHSVPIGGGSISVIADGQNGPVQLAEDGTYLFWTNFGGTGAVRRMRKDGSDLTSLAQATGPWALTLGGNYVYWTNTSDGSLRRVLKSGGQAVVLLNGESSPRGITVDSTHMYWTTSGGGQVRRANLDGSGVETLVSGQNYPLGIAVDGTWIYWTEVGESFAAGDCTQADGRILRARKNDGSDRTTLADNQACPLNLLVAATSSGIGHVYWTNAGTVTGSTYNYDGTVQRIDTSGTNLRLVASGQHRPYGIVANADTVFWTNQGVFASQGTVMKLAR